MEPILAMRLVLKVSSHLLLMKKQPAQGIVTFKVFPFGLCILISASLLLCSTFSKVLFQDHHQLFHHILFNLNHSFSKLILVLKKSRNSKEQNLNSMGDWGDTIFCLKKSTQGIILNMILTQYTLSPYHYLNE